MRRLESSKLFPYIAWGSILLFSVLTLVLVARLQTTVTQLDLQTQKTLGGVNNT